LWSIIAATGIGGRSADCGTILPHTAFNVSHSSSVKKPGSPGKASRSSIARRVAAFHEGVCRLLMTS